MPLLLNGADWLYDPDAHDTPMRVACLMSGSGANVEKVIEHQYKTYRETRLDRLPYRVVAIFTDNRNSRAWHIARKFDVAYECEDIGDFYNSIGQTDKRDLTKRPDYFSRVVRKLEQYKPELYVLGGFMSVVTEPLLSMYRGVNVHPADLAITENGRRKYTGDNAVLNQILAGEKTLRSSTHIVRKKVDYGEILMVSQGVNVDIERAFEELEAEGSLGVNINSVTLNYLRKPQHRETAKKIAARHQNWLKEVGDWVVLPETVDNISRGRVILENGIARFGGIPEPNGYRL
ncbi:MAG: formyltransferase family protein [Candidatus Aenigmatarchaeota archaeon]